MLNINIMNWQKTMEDDHANLKRLCDTIYSKGMFNMDPDDYDILQKAMDDFIHKIFNKMIEREIEIRKSWFKDEIEEWSDENISMLRLKVEKDVKSAEEIIRLQVRDSLMHPLEIPEDIAEGIEEIRSKIFGD